MAKGAEGDGGVVGEGDLQEAEVVNDWGGDGGDEEEDGCCKEQEGAHVVEHAGSRHFEGVDGYGSGCLERR